MQREPSGLLAKPCIARPNMAPEMVIIPAGRFYMGSPDSELNSESDEKPRHGVTIVQPFAMSRCEIMLAEFRAFVEDSSYVPESQTGGCYALKNEIGNGELRKDRDWRNPGFQQAGNHPVVCISWRDAQAYAHWLSLRTGERYRLPTEAEWEYAARAGTQSARYWINDKAGDVQNIRPLCAYANGADLSLKSRFKDWKLEISNCNDNAVFTAPSGLFQRNSFGLSDMLGNVWEWTADCVHDNYQHAPVDGSAWLDNGIGDCSPRVLRGGGWNSEPQFLRSTNRLRFFIGVSDSDVGFRLARAL